LSDASAFRLRNCASIAANFGFAPESSWARRNVPRPATHSSHSIRIDADHNLDYFPALFLRRWPALAHLLGDAVERLAR